MWDDQTFKDPFKISRKVNASEIQEIIWNTGAWKAPGINNWLLTGFLKACGHPLAAILAEITNVSFKLEYYLKWFYAGGVVVLAKAGENNGTKVYPRRIEANNPTKRPWKSD